MKIKNKKWFITGGAGFIGSHVVNLLVSSGAKVAVYDNLSLSTDQYIQSYIKQNKIKFFKHDLLDLKTLTKVMNGYDIVWHLGANTDIPSGFSKHRIDLDNDVIATWNVLEAMLKNNIKEILFSSTGAIYGESVKGKFKESSGPLIPLSLYGAGKIASEAFISSYCNLFNIQAWIFRFGNVIGERTNHGIIFDFIHKLRKNPQELEILGTGIGEKNYFLVEECINGILYTYNKVHSGPFPVIVNLGTDSTSKIMNIAKIIIDEMGLKNVRHRFTGTARGWPGDQPTVLLNTEKIHKLGWFAKKTSDQAVRIAVRRLLGKEKFQLSINNFDE
ncbi:hypothetical protein A3C23_01715 [Candidatus Roizmanbacteria bacterium RIFCSPHIGHO2_02_FULL_37_13b]|uniref:NAD-dependent epimerase/dehydratase domain-containing protein n=1 Tax=Candidatus Roizmanbacteria bacterium RIFCSPLOWO2_02_FULL_36_11 TaxID=1802071 RepID=A0A1F7JCW9_9BACT|nr:MAG: hypothetical protein A3C23_01715 [Candidatus Roizmanbacteria bacterium RIFCSPHIGHO2_02_FULL_37_13b]OGK53453.1 MAG: hypothetical protein A3H78_02875 [Candidatus Roizmanbacteria bacterium RIFCSPLOWO2_02_FULL_36_11]